jgi:UDP-N-acetylmuramoyl-tripeptide--D-alanyl-D-alanine ligase
LAAAATGRIAGIGLASIVKNLESQEAAPGRMQLLQLPGEAVAVCDDFKASFETVHAALDVLGGIRGRRRVAVLGSLYQPPPPRVSKYEKIGEQLARTADRVILVGERTRLYRRGWQGLLKEEAVTTVATVEEAVEHLRAELGRGDVVLFKGRGEQKLSRIALALSGVKVGCCLTFCKLENVLCQDCPKLGSE